MRILYFISYDDTLFGIQKSEFEKLQFFDLQQKK